ncbi:pyridoxal phosphate-dependent decarboxylase family protein [Defluviimonas sp. SAOS-178_SWC]|uniref:pyridoxal phosphate-dependent decarboxylase family protein n=1 Tax=Defluviimonas sp. SAOS-178_SWC TaxID=3121287 RepID=UPI003221FE81
MSVEAKTLDPDDWEDMRRLAHRIVDDAIDYTRDVRDRPVWQEMPDDVRRAFAAPLPRRGRAPSEVYETLKTGMMPYPLGNIHPRFWMWYMGASNFTGALGDFLAAILGSNLGGGNHSAALIDRQVVDWMKEIVGYPAGASGTLVSGGSVANLIGLTVARNVKSPGDARADGICGDGGRLRFYGSDQLHSCHQIALESLGLGRAGLRKLPARDDGTLDPGLLAEAVSHDRSHGLRPACVIATAGTVNAGAIDDLRAIGAFCRDEGLWFHVDGCIGGLLALSPRHRSLVDGMSEADSIAIDPHKWLHAPFEVGCALVRDRAAHRATFEKTPEYLQQKDRGIAASEWLHDYGVQTSRGFRALKVWMALQEHGADTFGALIDQDITHATYLADRVEAVSDLELVAKRVISIVCFRFNPGDLGEDALRTLNTEILLRMQEDGVAAVSDTVINGRFCLRAAINNHRTRKLDIDILVDAVLTHGRALVDELSNGQEVSGSPSDASAS